MWTSSSVISEQHVAEQGCQSTLEDDLWQDFLFQIPSSFDDVVDSMERALLPDNLPETARSLESVSSNSEITVPDAVAQTSSAVESTLEVQPALQASRKMNVHWLGEILQERDPKRHKPDTFSSVISAIPSTDLPKKMAPLEVGGSDMPDDFLMPSQESSERDSLGVSSLLDTESPSPGVHSADIDVPNLEIDVTATETTSGIAELQGLGLHAAETTSGIAELQAPELQTSKDLSASGDVDSAGLSAVPASAEIPRVLSRSNLLILGQETRQKVNANQITSHRSSGKAPKSHHLKLVERNMEAQVVSSARASVDSSLQNESQWAAQLLVDCAIAISSENFVRTQHLMWVLNDLGCLSGDANQRLAAHGLKSLFCKITGTSEVAGTNKVLGQVNAGPKTVHQALLKFHDVNPWHHMIYTVANSVLVDNFEDDDRVHVIDIGVSQGTQWPTFIEALATRATGPPLLRLTVVVDEEGPYTAGVTNGPSSTDFTAQLERFAKLMGITIEVNTVVSSLENLTREKLALKEGEALAVCAQFRLHRLPETVYKENFPPDGTTKSHLSSRDRFLQFMHDLQPKVVILSDNDIDHLSPDFVTRFRPAVDYFWKFLDSTSFSFHGKESQERQIIEYEAAMAMINNVACEGHHRIERNESHLGWALRMERAGFAPIVPREEILEIIRVLIRKYDINWEYGIDMDCVVLLWKHQPVTFCSVWKPSLKLTDGGLARQTVQL